MMSDAEFGSKLSEVFQTLLNLNKPISDDTCLHRLQDILKTKYFMPCIKSRNSSQSEYFVGTIMNADDDCPGLDLFIKSVTAKVSGLEPSVVTFALHLCGQWVPPGGVSDVVRCLYQAISDQKLWQDASVGTAYFDSLKEVAHTAHNTHGWKWIVEEGADYLPQAVQCLKEGSSLFLHTAARELISVVLGKLEQELDEDETRGTLKCFCGRLVDDFLPELQQAVKSPKKNLSIYLLNLIAVLVTSDVLLQVLVSKEEILKQLLVLCLYGQTGSSCEELLLKCLDKESLDNESLDNEGLDNEGLDNESLDDESLGKPEKITRFLEEDLLSLDHKNLTPSTVCKFHRLAIKVHQRNITNGTLEEIIKLPFSIVLGNIPSMLDLGWSDAFRTAMSSQSKCTQLLCQTVAYLAKTGGGFETLLSILECTYRGSYNFQSDSPNVQPSLMCSRFRLCLLEGISTRIHEHTRDEAAIAHSLELIIDAVTGTDVHNGVQRKGYECIISLLASLAWTPNKDDQLKSYLLLSASQLERCLVGVQWESRDTALETVSKLVSQLRVFPDVMPILASCRLLPSAWQCVSDSDSYVRASAIKLTGTMTSSSQIWQVFVSPPEISQELIIQRLMEILATDTEAFPRRAAVTTLHSIYTRRRLPSAVITDVYQSMLKAMADFDWEVKANALDFWKFVADQKINRDIVPDYASGLGSSCSKRKDNPRIETELLDLHQTGFFKAIVSAVDDYDQHVCEKAYEILKQLKGKLNIHSISSAKIKNLKCANSGSLRNSSDDDGQDSDCLTTVLDLMKSTDIEEKLSWLSGDVDVYSHNPVALLEDILSEDKDDDEDKFVDCY